MSDDGLTTRVLIEIRDEIRDLRRDANARIDETNMRLEQLSQRVDRGFEQTSERLDRLRTELKDEIRDVDLRAQTRMVDLMATATRTNELLQDRFQLRDRVEHCEQEIEELKKRIG